jgi:predicted dehydrogenase
MQDKRPCASNRAAPAAVDLPRRRLIQAALAAAGASTVGPGALQAARSSTDEAQKEKAVNDSKHTLVVVNPGHFHAALTLRKRHPRLSDDVYVYAEDGPDVESFLRMVRTFNERSSQPTRWNLYVHRGADYMEKLRKDRAGDIAIVAGKNDAKMRTIHELHGDGYFVLGDKPWLIGADELPMLSDAATTRPLAMDIMTERHEITMRVQKALADRPEVFGRFRTNGTDPAIQMESVHHLYKIVNQRPLVRPAWFFDLAAQGEGITDVTTHLVDLSQWLTGGGKAFDYKRDMELMAARQWPTEVPRDVFARITGLDDFPPAIRSAVSGDALQYLCNAQIDYRLRGVSARIVSLWNLAVPEKGGDTHNATMRGTQADLVIDQGPETGFATRLSIRPASPGKGYETKLADAVASLQPQFPGLAVEPDGQVYRVVIPKALRTTHEEHFAAVLEDFLGYIDRGQWPENLGPDLVAKYTLLAHARQLSHQR